MVKLVNPQQPQKVPPPIEVTPEGMVKLVKPQQPVKASLPIEVTLEGISFVNPLQLSALPPIEVTLKGCQACQSNGNHKSSSPIEATLKEWSKLFNIQQL